MGGVCVGRVVGLRKGLRGIAHQGRRQLPCDMKDFGKELWARVFKKGSMVRIEVEVMEKKGL